MRVIVFGADGYIGWPLTQALLREGHKVFCIDNGSRRLRVSQVGGNSITPILSLGERVQGLRDTYGDSFLGWTFRFIGGSKSELRPLSNLFSLHSPDAIFHLAQQPSAAYSMKDCEHASVTQLENLMSTLHVLWAMKESCPQAHLIKIGTMGEYGTPNCDIP